MKLLIIDENDLFRKNLKHALTKLSLVVLEVNNDPSKINKILSEHADISELLLDFTLREQIIQSQNNEKGLIRLDNKRLWFVTSLSKEKLPSKAEICADYANFEDIFFKPVSAQKIYQGILNADLQQEYSQFIQQYPYLENFPLPLRVIDSEEQIIFHNGKWNWDVTYPAVKFKNNDTLKIPTEFTDISPKSINKILRAFWIEEGQYLAEFCNDIKPMVQDLDTAKDYCFTVMENIGFSRARFYWINKTPDINNQDQEILRLCKVNGKILKNKVNLKKNFIQYPLEGCLKKRLKNHQQGKAIIRYKTEDDSSDKGIRYWNDIIDMEELDSWLEIPFFIKGKIKALMVFDKIGSNFIGNHDPNRVPKSILKTQKELIARIIEDIEKHIENDIKKKEADILEKLKKLDEELINPDIDIQQIKYALLYQAVDFTQSDGGLLIDKKDSKTLTVIEEMGEDQISFKNAEYSSPETSESPVIASFNDQKKIILQDYKSSSYYIDKHDPETLLPLKIAKDKSVIKWLEDKVFSIAYIPVVYKNNFFGVFSLHSEKSTYFFDENKLQALDLLMQRALWFLTNIELIKEEKSWVYRSISHEIRSDTAPILHALAAVPNNLKTTYKDEFNIIENHTDNIKTLIANIFTLQDEKNPLSDTQPFNDYKNSFENILKLLDANRKNVNIDFSQLNNKKNSVWQQTLSGNKQIFERVIRVLIDNAIRYSVNKQPVKIKLNLKNDYLEIRIKNHGQLTVDTEKYLFNPFKHTNDKAGLHIGLAACKKIVDSIKGRLVIKNLPQTKQVEALLAWPLHEKKNDYK